jgi:hypothetical protein
MNAPELNQATAAIVRVGEGRGFIVQGDRDRYVITAAHCLPFIPRCDDQERTYRELIGAMENEKNNVWAECTFFDVVADIAVLGPPEILGPPHYQVLEEQKEAYSRFARSRPAMCVGKVPELVQCVVTCYGWKLAKLLRGACWRWVRDNACGRRNC